MDCQRPVKNEKSNKWEVWDFAYEEDGERHYELHEFFTYKDAIEFWKVRNPKNCRVLAQQYTPSDKKLIDDWKKLSID